MVRTITWTATDDCGNDASASRTFTISDTVDPQLAGLPNNASVLCGHLPSASDFNVTATDNCDNNVAIASTFVDAASGCNIVRTITWTATDDCGNDVSASRSFTTNDNVAPELFGVPANATMQCGVQVPDAVVYATDNCDNDLVVSLNAQTIANACGYSLVRTWSVTDDCGNTASLSQTTTFIDTTDPSVANVPTAVTIDCHQALPTTEPIFSDNCDSDVEVIYTVGEPQQEGCGVKVARMWRAIDNCGNETIVTQFVTKLDMTAPVLQNTPENLNVQCDAIPAPANVTANDNCGNFNPVFTEVISEGCPYTITRTWVVTDNCGNQDTHTQTIAVVDQEDPELIGVPDAYIAQCGQAPAPAMVMASDNCTQVLDMQFNEQVVSASCPIELIRTWTVVDACGNSTSASQLIFIQDTIAPVITAPADMNVECSNLPTAPTLTATDNCDNNVEVSYDEEIIPMSDCQYTIVRTWTAMDDCGNSSAASQTLTVVDNSLPTFPEVPANITVNCDAIPNASAIIAQDNCDSDVAVELTEVISNGCPYTITRTWVGIDNCGNQATVSQVITVVDEEDPILYGMPANFTLQCSEPMPDAVVVAVDNCDDNAIVSLDAVTTPLPCGFMVTRTWNATDNCGNVVSATQITTFVDDVNPSLEAEVVAEITVQCDQALPQQTPSFLDNCDDELAVTYNQDSISVNGCNYDLIRTWTATDNCGNAFSTSQTIHVVDTTLPVLSGVPANATVNCNAIPAAAAVTANDNCTAVIDVVFGQTQTEGCPYTITRTWSATDACGNTATASQILTVVDTVDPQLVGVPANATVECSAIPTAPAVTATDNCSQNVVPAYNEVIHEGNGCSYTIVRTWSATDACGNATSASQTLTVVDTTDPVLQGVPQNSTAECGQVPAAASVSAIDNCDEEVVVTMSETQGTGCPYSITRTWTATDDCGNTSTASQVITVVDTTAPSFDDAPASITVACDAVPSAMELTANDICDSDVAVTFSQAQTTGCPYTITRTWIATDNCNNQSTHVQVLTVVDELAPTLYGVPADMELECGQPIPPAVVHATDNCDQDMVVSLEATTANNACGSVLTRVWSVTDDCGNTTTATQVVSIIDTTEPQLNGVPANATVNCNAIPAAAAVTANDNCTAVIDVVFGQTQTEGCPYTITRTWSATDACGNTATASQILTVVDTVDPQLVGVPANATVECSAIPTAPAVTATDNCSQNVVPAYNEVIHEGNGCSYTIVRTWSATDACGNATSASQTLTVVDTTDPVLQGVPQNSTAECGQVPAAASVSAIDNCDEEVVVTMSETQGTGCPYSITRTWTATDDCGNTSTASQVITVVDTEAPIISGVPGDIFVECDAIPALAAVTAYDVCSGDVDVVFQSIESPLNCGTIITRTWTATDACGNAASLSQHIHVIDETAPFVIDEPADTTISCGSLVPVLAPVFGDVCDLNLAIEYSEHTEAEDCTFAIVRQWTATDNCGNMTQVEQIVHVVDETDPVLNNVPSDATVSCSSIPAVALVTGSDNCDTDVAVAYSEAITTGCPYTITRTWVATDNCGNSTTASQVLTVNDTALPQLIGVPASMTVECGTTIPDAQVSAIDNCTSNLQVEMSASVAVSGCNSIITRTWTTQDACGNVATATQIIQVIDSTDPILVSVPANVSVDCGAVPAPASVTATDNCSSNVTPVMTETVSQGCPYTITRTWTATDACGNSAQATQVITVLDEIAPLILNVPTGTTLECNGQVPPISSDVYAQDNCDNNVEVTTNEVLVQQTCGYQIKRFYYATDDCGNTATAVEIIYVIDETEPQLFNVPSEVTVSCDEALPAVSDDVEATDNCDQNVNIAHNDVIVMQECGYQIKRFYVATDDCGNTATAVQMITLVDEVAPVFPAIEEEIMVNCGEVPAPLELVATDNCDNSLTYSYSENVMSTGCPYQIKRIWTATDDCGNQGTAVQVINVIDEVNPYFNAFPVFVEMECDEVANYTLTAADACDDDVTVSIVSEVVFSGSCYGTIQRIYEATDDCGNMATAIQLIDIIDNTPPIIHNVPQEIFLTCGDALPAIPTNVVASDNCTSDVTLSYEEFVTGVYCPYDVVRTWTAVDLCGNTTVATQTIHYTVDVAPVVYLNAYPNPASSGDVRVQFSVPVNTYANAMVVDVSGREVEILYRGMAQTGTLYEFTLDQEKYAAGTYTIRVIVGEEVYSQRLMLLDSGQ